MKKAVMLVVLVLVLFSLSALAQSSENCGLFCKMIEFFSGEKTVVGEAVG